MIFATLGTDEHPFGRLLQELERLVREGKIKERVVVQRGFTPYDGELLETYEILPFDKLVNLIKEARVVIAHGGPGSIMLSLLHGKKPVVVPRRREFGEVVDDHQMEFVKFLQSRGKVITVYEVNRLGEVLENYRADKVIYSVEERVSDFTVRFEELISHLKDS